MTPPIQPAINKLISAPSEKLREFTAHRAITPRSDIMVKHQFASTALIDSIFFLFLKNIIIQAISK